MVPGMLLQDLHTKPSKLIADAAAIEESLLGNDAFFLNVRLALSCV
jgi:hypothetical protein